MYDNLLANVPTDLWIGGKWRKSSDNQRFDVIDPATEKKVASVASATVRGRHRRGRCREQSLRRLGRQKAARARRDPAQVVRADHARRRTAREADHGRERQGAAGFARRSRLCRRILPLERGGSGSQSRAIVARTFIRRPHHGAAQAGGGGGAGDAVEFPGRHGDPQDRAGARRRLHGRAQAGVRHAADHARA